MTLITNLMFWLTSAMETIASALGLAIVVFAIGLVGIGFGVGRIWNAKWKISSIGILVSFPISFIAAILTMVYVAMGFIAESYSRANLTTQTQSLYDSLSKPGLVKKAFESGVKQVREKGNEVDPSALENVETNGLIIPGNDPETKSANTRLFLAGAMDVINNGVTAPGKSDTKLAQGLVDQAPFKYGFKTVAKPTEGIVAQFVKEIAECGLEGMPFTLTEPIWYDCIMKPVVQANIAEFDKQICKEIESSRSNTMILIIVLLLLQSILISWLAFIDIKPRKINLV